MSWNKCYENILPYVFAIETPEGSGSGVYVATNSAKNLAVVATAAHVVEHADDWRLPIKLKHHSSGKESFLQASERVIFLDRRRDSACILVPAGAFDLPAELLPMMPADKYKPIGNEVGWVGYPGIASPHLCFFSGRLSAFLVQDDSYLIDGVAIHGVSGGPVFAMLAGDKPQLLGTVSAYMPNRIRGDALPGMLRAQDVTTFHETIKTIRTLDEARERQEAEARKLEEERKGENPVPASVAAAGQPVGQPYRASPTADDARYS